MQANKFKLRTHFRELRHAIPLAYRQTAAIAAADLFAKQAIFAQAELIACYVPFKDEFDSSPLIEAIWRAKKQCYLPVLSAENKKLLTFVNYRYGDALHTNRFGILEPAKITRTLAAADFDLVITPLLAFDTAGHRLGTGGGYYDYTFAFMKTVSLKKPSLVGLGYAAQQAPSLPDDPWDIQLNAVITEKNFLLI